MKQGGVQLVSCPADAATVTQVWMGFGPCRPPFSLLLPLILLPSSPSLILYSASPIIHWLLPSPPLHLACFGFSPPSSTLLSPSQSSLYHLCRLQNVSSLPHRRLFFSPWQARSKCLLSCYVAHGLQFGHPCIKMFCYTCKFAFIFTCKRLTLQFQRK